MLRSMGRREVRQRAVARAEDEADAQGVRRHGTHLKRATFCQSTSQPSRSWLSERAPSAGLLAASMTPSSGRRIASGERAGGQGEMSATQREVEVSKAEERERDEEGRQMTHSREPERRRGRSSTRSAPSARAKAFPSAQPSTTPLPRAYGARRVGGCQPRV